MLFSWANSQLEKLSETLAPPPNTPGPRFIAALASSNENAALAMLNDPHDPLDPNAPLNQRGMTALHVAAAHGSLAILRDLLQRRINVESTDGEGMTPLHHASASSGNPPAALATVKFLVEECGANVLSKSYAGATPYDVASAQSVRGYLLPKQLQKETKECLDNGGVGLVPGMDLGGMTVARAVAPPPTAIGGGTVPTVGAAGGADIHDPVAALMKPTVSIAAARHQTPVKQQQQQPTQQPMQPKVMETASKMTPDALPEGWIEATDPTSGNIYYYNNSTGVSSWDRPSANALCDDPARSVIGTTSKEENIDSVVAQEQSHATPALDHNNSHTDLPKGWIAATDPSSGNYYYYNQELKVTQWKRPALKTGEKENVDDESKMEVAPTTSVSNEAASITPANVVVGLVSAGDKGKDDASDNAIEESAAPAKALTEPVTQVAQEESVNNEPSAETRRQQEEQPPAAEQKPSPQLQQSPAQPTPTAHPQQQSSSCSTKPNTRAPSSGRSYALRGGDKNSAAAILANSSFSSAGRRVYKPDGFHTSSNDQELQAKYGHVTNEHERSRKLAAGAPPISGGAPNSGGYYAGGGASKLSRYPTGAANVTTYKVSGIDPQQQKTQQPWSGGLSGLKQQQQQPRARNGNTHAMFHSAYVHQSQQQPTPEHPQQQNNQAYAFTSPVAASPGVTTNFSTMVKQQAVITPATSGSNQGMAGAESIALPISTPSVAAPTASSASAQDVFSQRPSSGGGDALIFSSTPIVAALDTPHLSNLSTTADKDTTTTGGETSSSSAQSTGATTAAAPSMTSPLKSLPPPPCIGTAISPPYKAALGTASPGSKPLTSSFLPPPPMVATTLSKTPVNDCPKDSSAVVTEDGDQRVSEQLADVEL